MKMGPLLALGLLLGLSACKEADSTVLVNVSINPDVPPVYSLRVAMSSPQTHDIKIYPAKMPATALPSGSSLVIILPRLRTGRLDLAVDGIDNAGRNVAHGASQATIVVGGSVTASVVLVAGPALCGNTALDSGENCDDGNLFSFDGCDFRCQAEGLRADAAVPDGSAADAPDDVAVADVAVDLPTSPDLPAVGVDIALDVTRDLRTDLPEDAVDAPAVDQDAAAESKPVDLPRSVDVTADSGSPATGGSTSAGGMKGTGGLTSAGGATGTGGLTGSGGSTGTGGAACTGSGVARVLTTLVSDTSAPQFVAVGGTNVYWTSIAAVMKVPSGGGTPITLAPGGGSGIAVDALNVYWLGSGKVMKLPIGGGTPTALASGQGNLLFVAIDATSVYWGDYGTRVVNRVPIAGGTITPIATGQNGLLPVAVGATNVYWGSYDAVMTAPISGGTATALATAPSTPVAIAVDTTAVYWASRDGGTVMMVPLGGGTPRTLASGQMNPNGLAIDATCVYWTNSGDGTVMKVPISGGTPTTLATSQSGPGSIAVDATSLYWANTGGTTVMKLTPK